MAIPAGLSLILTKIAPEKIVVVVEQILKILDKINKVVLEINSIDFCNPLGYILTKALPPGGVLEGKLLQFGKTVTDFINLLDKKLAPGKRPDETEEQYQERIKRIKEDIEEIRQSLADLIPPPELLEIIPGGEGLVKTTNTLNLALTVGSDVANAAVDPNELMTKISLLQSFARKLAPFTSPINIANLIIGDKAEDLNKLLSDFIKPERFKESLAFIIRQVQAIDKAITQIQILVKLISNILKTILVLIKVYRFILKILKLSPRPIAVGGGGAPVIADPDGKIARKAERIAKINQELNDFEKLIKMVKTFLDVSILLQIQRIRREIRKLITGLNVLYKNLSACQYTNDQQTLQSIQDSIDSLNRNLQTLDELFPGAKDIESILPKQYNGYQIDIIKEEVTDEGISLIRRRVVVADQRGIIQYEGKPTYASKDYILVNEGQYYIDKQLGRSTSDEGNDSPSDQDITNIVKEIGLDPTDTLIGPVEPD
jgi:hypothetical protein